MWQNRAKRLAKRQEHGLTTEASLFDITFENVERQPGSAGDCARSDSHSAPAWFFLEPQQIAIHLAPARRMALTEIIFHQSQTVSGSQWNNLGESWRQTGEILRSDSTGNRSEGDAVKIDYEKFIAPAAAILRDDVFRFEIAVSHTAVVHSFQLARQLADQTALGAKIAAPARGDSRQLIACQPGGEQITFAQDPKSPALEIGQGYRHADAAHDTTI